MLVKKNNALARVSKFTLQKKLKVIMRVFVTPTSWHGFAIGEL